jgi:hypothetical protein
MDRGLQTPVQNQATDVLRVKVHDTLLGCFVLTVSYIHHLMIFYPGGICLDLVIPLDMGF